MSSVKISVVMSVYNAEAYLERAIESILTQVYKNIEFVIINDGSSDKSLSIIQNFGFKDNRIVIIDQNNMGLTKALNVGIERATGDYIARMDADDISMPNRFENFIRFIEEHGSVDLYSTPAFIIDEYDDVKKVIPNYFRRNGFKQKLLNYYNSMVHGTLIVKSSILKRFRYNEEFKYSQDFELYHRLMKNGCQVSYDANNVSYQLRLHSNSITNTQKPEQLELFKKIFEDNRLKFYKQNYVNRLFFKFVDFSYYINSSLRGIVPKRFRVHKN